jgi:two-component system sensor histidine kinase PilS (NtrC family)
MSAVGGSASADSVLGAREDQRLIRLLAARVSLTVLSLGIAVVLDGLGREMPPEARQGLYLTVAAAFATTVVSGLWIRRATRVDYFAAAQIAIDVAIVTSLVHYSGGRESIFTFLYVVVTLYGAILFERRGAIVSATLSACAYGAVLFGSELGWWAEPTDSGQSLPLSVLLAIWGVHVGALYLVGVLASLLSSELQRTGRALDQSTSDLRRLRDLHQQTVVSIMSGLLTTDRDGRVTSFNPEAERITGLSASQAIGKLAESVIPGITRFVEDPREPAGSAAGPRNRVVYRSASGGELHLGLAASVLKDGEGGSPGHVVIFQDVTDVVGMERDLRSNERLAAVGEMAAKIAHEVRNPLASMSGSIQLLRGALEQGEEGDENRRLMDIVLRETDRLNALITDFLQYSRPTPPSLKEVAIGPLIDEVAELLESTRPPEIALELACEAAILAHADPDQLKQVLWNLSINAIQAMPSGGRMRIVVDLTPGDPPQDGASFRRNEKSQAGPTACGDRPWVEIAISDTGVGMSPEVQERIFEPFYTTKVEGTGLGLATVHRIMEGHGGFLLLESEEERGTTFRVVLPSSEESA